MGQKLLDNLITCEESGLNAPRTAKRINGDANKLMDVDRPIHSWYRFVLSYPPHFVRTYLQRFGLDRSSCVLDPFCGTGTTLVECRKNGIESIGVESNAMALFASQVKTDWSPDPTGLVEYAKEIARIASDRIRLEAGSPGHITAHVDRCPRTLDSNRMGLLLTNSISPLPLHKTLILLEALEENRDDRYYNHARLALANALVSSIGNLHFGPEVGAGRPKTDAPVVESWMCLIQGMARDLHRLVPPGETVSRVLFGDARHLQGALEPASIDAVITSPPYPNEKDYTRTTRLESVLLGFINSKQELRDMKKNLIRSNTRGVYRDDDDGKWVEEFPGIQDLADAIETRRLELGKTSGFERMYARVVRLYFGGMARHFAELSPALRPGARLAYVVGDQASYLQVMIRTGQVLAEIAESLGYEVTGIDLFRTRMATATRQELREEVLLLRWPG